MDCNPTVAEQRTLLEHDITHTRAAQRALELQKDDEIAKEYRLLADLDRVRSLEGRLDRQIEEKRDAINSLQDEISGLA